MKIKEIIFESTGGIGRRWIETQLGKPTTFRQGKELWTLVDLQCFPPNPKLQYEDLPATKTKSAITGKDQVINAVNIYLQKKYPAAPLSIVGKIGKAGMLVVLKNAQNQYKAFLKITKAKANISNNPIFWQTTEFANDTQMNAQTAQFKKALIPLEPADLIEPGKNYTVDTLIATINQKIKFTEVDPILADNAADLLRQVEVGETSPIAELAQFKSAIEIKLGEIAAPIAVISGELCTGQYEDAENNLLLPMGIKNGFSSVKSISFPNKAERLIDSYLVLPNGKKISVSSKDSGGGAKPSTATIAESLKNKATEFAKIVGFEKFKYIQENIMTLDTMSGVDGPIALAVKFRIITAADSNYLKSIYGKGFISNRVLNKNAAGLLQLIKESPYTPDYAHPEYQTGYHILAVIARMVADHMNKNSKLITDFFKTVLNKSDMIQVLASTQVQGDALCFKSFHVIYPPTFSGTIRVDAGSFTSRTRPTRKMAFEFKH